MRKFITTIIAALTGCSAGCSRDAATPVQSPQSNAAQRTEVVNTTTINGFDDDGDPELREMNDGSMEIVFNFMPPSWVSDDQYTPTDLGPFREFDKRMANALGVQVTWDDRERFIIRQPKADTAEKLKQFLASERPKQ